MGELQPEPNNSGENYLQARAMINILAQMQSTIRQVHISDRVTREEILRGLVTTEAALHRWRYNEGLTCGEISPPVLRFEEKDC